MQGLEPTSPKIMYVSISHSRPFPTARPPNIPYNRGPTLSTHLKPHSTHTKSKPLISTRLVGPAHIYSPANHSPNTKHKRRAHHNIGLTTHSLHTTILTRNSASGNKTYPYQNPFGDKYSKDAHSFTTLPHMPNTQKDSSEVLSLPQNPCGRIASHRTIPHLHTIPNPHSHGLPNAKSRIKNTRYRSILITTQHHPRSTKLSRSSPLAQQNTRRRPSRYPSTNGRRPKSHALPKQ